jgi:hypothetical protein
MLGSEEHGACQPNTACPACYPPRTGTELEALSRGNLMRPALASALPSCEHHVEVDDKQWDQAVRENVVHLVNLVT